MFDFLGRGKPKADHPVADPGPSTLPQPAPLSATQREMVRMTLHGVLRMHGIPGSWVGGEVIPIVIPGKASALLLQLEIMHWHDALVLHAPALQEALLAGLKRFDPHADKTQYLFSWKFSPDCGCPHTDLPEPSFWNVSKQSAVPPVMAAPVVAAVAATIPFDLPPSAMDNAESDDDDGFAPTQIHESR